jgi:hypothetical protein
MAVPDRMAVPDPTVPAEALTEAIVETNQIFIERRLQNQAAISFVYLCALRG